jgi:hypothetical protein
MYLSKRNIVSLYRFGIYCIFSLSFNIINSVDKVNPCCLPILLFDELSTSHRHVISSYVFKSKLFHLVAIIRVFQNFAVTAN